MQLHFYVPDDIAAAVQRRARSLGLSVSKYLAELASREVAAGWPEGYFESVVGAWKGRLERAPQGKLERREPL